MFACKQVDLYESCYFQSAVSGHGSGVFGVEAEPGVVHRSVINPSYIGIEDIAEEEESMASSAPATPLVAAKLQFQDSDHNKTVATKQIQHDPTTTAAATAKHVLNYNSDIELEVIGNANLLLVPND